jgi:acetyl/propionyl-CoA carboxylase alpha subunit
MPKLFVANRGEAAARILTSAQALGWTSAVPWLASERAHWWASLADVLLPLPEGAWTQGEALAQAALDWGADAVHPGWGLLAEAPALAEAVLRRGMRWVGPPPAAMRRLGDKAEAAQLARSVGLPCLPGGAIAPGAPAPEGPYPVLAKARRGGGGLGQAIAESPEAWPRAAAEALAQARASFGAEAEAAGLLWCPHWADARHVEVQVAVDASGEAKSLGLRDCSVQRRRQKLIEESPAPGLPAAQGARLEAWACQLLQAAGYQGLGTVEFLVQGEALEAFLEVNARLQVEHPLTEWRWGLDLVALQLDLAAGASLAELGPWQEPRGWAIEARLLSESPDGALPSPGPIHHLLWPGGPFVRVDPGVGAPDEVHPDFDPMLAKVSAWGANREEARRRLLAALGRLELVGDLDHNLDRLRQLLAHPDFVAAKHHVQWAPSAPPRPPAPEAPAALPPARPPHPPTPLVGWPKPAWKVP